LFWVGVAMFLTAILTYVFSEDLSLRLRPHGPKPGGQANNQLAPVEAELQLQPQYSRANRDKFDIFL
jgi:hypothetical protein